MKKRTLALLLAVVMCLGALTACDSGSAAPTEPESSQTVEPSTKLSKPPKEDQILSDANAFGLEALEERNIVLTHCEVIKRQSNPDKKEDIVYCRLSFKNSFRELEFQYKFIYNFYDEGGWILDEAEPYKEDEWTDRFLDAVGNDVLEDTLWVAGRYEGAHNDIYFPRVWVKEGYRSALYGYVDRETGGVFYGCMYQYASSFLKRTNGQGYCAYVKSPDTNLYYFITEKGELSNKCYDNIVYCGQDAALTHYYSCLRGNQVDLLDETMTCLFTLPNTSSDGSEGSSNFRVLRVVGKGLSPFVDSNGLYGLMDLSGQVVLPGTYDKVSGALDGDVKNGIVVANGSGENIRYGTIDETGKEIITPTYSSVDELRKALGFKVSDDTIPEAVQKLAKEKSMEVYTLYGTQRRFMLTHWESNGGIRTECLVNERGEFIIEPFEGFLVSDVYGLLKKVSMNEDTLCYYDWNGNQRTPEFQLVGGRMSDLIEYEGRQGLLPDILSEEERDSFKDGSALVD